MAFYVDEAISDALKDLGHVYSSVLGVKFAKTIDFEFKICAGFIICQPYDKILMDSDSLCLFPNQVPIIEVCRYLLRLFTAASQTIPS